MAYASQHGYVLNNWGRRMPVQRDRVYTQGPALLGQSTTREVVCDGLLNMSEPALRRVKAQVHDALLTSVPARNWEQCRDFYQKVMAATFHPGWTAYRVFP